MRSRATLLARGLIAKAFVPSGEIATCATLSPTATVSITLTSLPEIESTLMEFARNPANRGRQLASILSPQKAPSPQQAAERNGTEQYPLYQWTKATIEDPAKKQKHLKSFSLH